MDRRDFLKASGWTRLGLAAAGTLPGCARSGGRDSLPGNLKKGFPSLKDLKVFWGDVHNHCNVTYGHGDLADALAAAKNRIPTLTVRDGAHEDGDEVWTLRDVPLCFGTAKRYRERHVTLYR